MAETATPALPVSANPFATKYVRPGALAYWFDPNSSLRDIGQLADKLAAGQFCGQIIGPHGSGKSTLMRSLAAELHRRGVTITQCRVPAADSNEPNFVPWVASFFHRRRPSMGTVLGEKNNRPFCSKTATPNDSDSAADSSCRVVLIDGFEQFSWWQRTWLRWTSRITSTGLVVTAHAKMGLPTLVETRVTAHNARMIVAQLCELVDCPGRAAEFDKQLEQRLKAHGGNLREALFELYDDW